MSVTSRQIRLAKRPVGLPDISTWELTNEDLPEPGPGQVLVAVDHISIDPAMRGWLNDTRSYVPPVAVGAGKMSGAGVVVGGTAARAVAVARRGGLDRSTPQAVRATTAASMMRRPASGCRQDRTRREA